MAKLIERVFDKITSFFQAHKDKFIIGGVSLIMIPLAYWIFVGIYSILCIFLPKFICILILLFLGYRMLFYVCRALTFPGSLWLWRRNLEFNYGRATANRLKEYIDELTSLSKHIMDDSKHKRWMIRTETTAIRDMIASVCELFKRQEESKTLNRRQKPLAKCFEELKHLLQKTNISRDVSGSVESYTYWEILVQELDLTNTNDTILLSFENEDQGKQILGMCAKITAILDDFVVQKNAFYALIRWFTNDTLGSLNQIREQLIERYEGKQIYLNVADNATLDCMLLPSYQPQENHKQHISARISTETDDSIQIMDNKAEAKFSNPTIIYCNPNAAYYELFYFDNDWIEFYLSRGVNVFLWNYRGYGRSSGKPTPYNIKSDGEQIVKYLQTTYNVKKIGAHGQSLGGSVVCHLAKHADLDYACADRTFSSPVNVADKAQGFILGKLYLWVTGWSDDSSKNFSDANCYKIMTFDPKDEIIPYLASLRNGVTNSTAERLHQFDSGNELSLTPRKKNNLFSPRGFSLMKLRFQSWLQARTRSSQKSQEILTPKQLLDLYSALKRISEIFFENSKIEIAALGSWRNAIKTPTKPQKPVVGNSTLEGQVGLETSSNDLNPERLATDDFDDIDEASPIRVTNPSLQPKKFIEKEGLSLKINKPKHSANAEFPTVSHQVKSYIPLLQDTDKYNQEFHSLISNIFNSFSILESGGLSLADTLIAGKRGVDFFKNQIQQFIDRLESIVQKKPSLQKALDSALTQDIDVIINGFAIVHQKLSLLYDRNFPEGVELKSYGRPSPVKEALHQTRSEHSSRNSFLEVGHVIPLTCGHNGYLSRSEMLAFESYFNSSDFAKH